MQRSQAGRGWNVPVLDEEAADLDAESSAFDSKVHILHVVVDVCVLETELVSRTPLVRGRELAAVHLQRPHVSPENTP